VLDAGTTGDGERRQASGVRQDVAGSILTPDACPLTPTAGRPYFVMELVKGVPITEYCDKNQLGTRERLELFVTVCQAVQHAHQKGLIHRDIKPANIMVTLHDGKPVPKIIDFGIAKALDRQLTEKTLFTSYGQMIGTPQYMSPEQAETSGLDVDTRSDVYSLGVVLYELLTGKTPLEAGRLLRAGYAEMQRLIREEEPPTPSKRISTLGEELTVIAENRSIDPQRLRQSLRGDPDWIVMKSLEKDRTRRYESASQFAEDIQRFLADQPVLACPPSAAYKLRKFVRRNKGPVAAAAALLVALSAGMAGTVTGLIRAENAATVATAEAGAATKARNRAQKAESIARQESERYRRLLYIADMNVALHAWYAGNVQRVLDLLKRHTPAPGAEDLRQFEWYYLFNLCQRSLSTPFLPDRSAAVAYFNHDSHLLALGNGPVVKLWDVPNRRIVAEFKGHEKSILDVAISPDDKWIASSDTDGVVKLWNVAERQEQATLKAEPLSTVSTLSFSGDGKLLAAAGWSAREVRVWDVQKANLVATLKGHRRSISGVAFSPLPQDRTLASGGWDSTIRLWKLETQKESATLPGDPALVRALAYSPDGRTLASGGVDGTVKLWDMPAGTLREVLHMDAGTIKALAFSRDGKLLAFGTVRNSVKLWDLQARRELDEFMSTVQVESLSFSADGKTLAVPDESGVKLWDLSRRFDPDRLERHAGEVISVALSPDGRTLASGGDDSLTKVWDLASGQARDVARHENGWSVVALSRDGKTLAVGADKNINLWNASKLTPLGVLTGHEAGIWAVEFSPDGRSIVSSGGDKTVRIWDVASQEELYRFDGHDGTVMTAAFSPDGRTIASGSGRIILWQPATGKHETLTFNQDGHGGAWSLDFSADGKTLAVARRTAVAVFNLAGGEQRTFVGHTDSVNFVVLWPDGRTLASSSGDGTVKLWDLATGENRFTFRDPMGSVGINCLALSRDGKLLALARRDGAIRLLRAATDDEVRAAGW
jgi:WD40 repeat protein